MKPVIFLDPATAELSEAAAFYNERVNGLGKQLISELERTLNRIRQRPRAGRLMNENTRRALLSRFPYAVLYREEEKQIVIVAFMYKHRKPNYWQGRS